MPGPNTPYTSLSSHQVLQQSFDETRDLLRVGVVGATLDPIQVGGMSIQISHTEDSVRLGDGTNYITSTTNGLKIGTDVNIINTSLLVNQGTPASIANAWTVKITDGTDNVILTPVKTAQNTSANDFGVITFGYNSDANPTKYRPIKVDEMGHQANHLFNTSNAQINPATSDLQTTLNTSINYLTTNRQKILKSGDLVETYTYADFGTVNERVTTIVYSSASLALSATKTFAYTLVGVSYRLDTITWS